MKASFTRFIIFISIVVSGCSVFSGDDASNRQRVFRDGEKVGVIESVGLSESSGIAASRCNEEILWSHNDSGEEPMIFAFDSSGKSRGEYRLANAENIDWEDIAIVREGDRCDIYVGDTGNNYSLRKEFSIYIVTEPNPVVAQTDTVSLSTRKIVFHYDLPRNTKVPDAETVMVHPTTKDIYIITKTRSGPASIFRIANDDLGLEKIVAKKVAVVSVPSIPPGLLTGGDISPDGRRIVLVDYLGAYEFSVAKQDGDFLSAFIGNPTLIRFGKRTQGESITYSNDGTSLFGTSEGVNPPLIRATLRND